MKINRRDLIKAIASRPPLYGSGFTIYKNGKWEWDVEQLNACSREKLQKVLDAIPGI